VAAPALVSDIQPLLVGHQLASPLLPAYASALISSYPSKPISQAFGSCDNQRLLIHINLCTLQKNHEDALSIVMFHIATFSCSCWRACLKASLMANAKSEWRSSFDGVRSTFTSWPSGSTRRMCTS
jgi:hypothetical protein